MDPHRPNLEAAGRALREFSATRRQLALAHALSQQQQANAEASPTGDDEGGLTEATRQRPASSVTQQPEFILPYLLYLLGHHPDMPQVSVGPHTIPSLLPPHANVWIWSPGPPG